MPLPASEGGLVLIVLLHRFVQVGTLSAVILELELGLRNSLAILIQRRTDEVHHLDWQVLRPECGNAMWT